MADKDLTFTVEQKLGYRIGNFQEWSCLPLISLVSPNHCLYCLFYISFQPHHSRRWDIYPHFWGVLKNKWEADCYCPPKSLTKEPFRLTFQIVIASVLPAWRSRNHMPDFIISILKLTTRFHFLDFSPIGSYFTMSFLRAVFQLRIFLGLWIYSWKI